MQQTRFNFALVFAIMVLMAYAYITFLGLAYWQQGNLLIPTILTAGLVIVVLTCIVCLCKSKASRWLKMGKIGQIAFGVVMLIMLLAASLPFTNFVRVTEKKKAIHNNITQTCRQAEDLSLTYEDYVNDRVVSYRSNLQQAVDGKEVGASRYELLVANASGNTDEQKIDGLVKSLERRLMPDSAQLIQNERVEWLKDASQASIWNPLTAANLCLVDSKVRGWVQQYRDLSAIKYNGESAKPFEYSDFNESMTALMDNFTTFHVPSVLAVIISLLCFGIMLLPYLLTETDVAANADETTFQYFETNFFNHA